MIPNDFVSQATPLQPAVFLSSHGTTRQAHGLRTETARRPWRHKRWKWCTIPGADVPWDSGVSHTSLETVTVTNLGKCNESRHTQRPNGPASCPGTGLQRFRAGDAGEVIGFPVSFRTASSRDCLSRSTVYDMLRMRPLVPGRSPFVPRKSDKLSRL